MRDNNIVNVVRISGLAVSIISTVTFALIGATSVPIAIVLGLIIAAITLLIDLIISTEAARGDVLAAIGLSKQLMSDQDAIDHMGAMTSALGRIERNGPVGGLFRKETLRALLHCATSLAQLAEGELTIEEDRRMESLIDLMDSCGENDVIAATSYVSISEWWQRPLAVQYLDACIRAAKRGVPTMRIFIARPTDGDPLREFARTQSDAGIDVRLIEEARVPPELRDNFFLIKQRVVSFADYSREGRLLRGRISTSPSILATYQDKLQLLKLSASKFDEFYGY